MTTLTESRESGSERLSNTDVDAGHPWFLHYRSLFADLRKASVHAQGRLLDLGCGNKPYKAMFDGHVSEYIGCDLVQSSKRLVDVLCSITELPFRSESYDTVLMTQVIEHVPDHQAVLREAFRVLRPDGVLILSGPMYWPLHGEPCDFFRFTEYGFRFLLDTVGFTEIITVNNGGKWALCGQVLIHSIEGTRIYAKMWVRVINKIFGFLDDRHPVPTNPMNYVVVAKKPAASQWDWASKD